MSKMNPMESGKVDWTRSSRCQGASCVEVAFLAGEVAVRDSKQVGQEDAPILRFTPQVWGAFIVGVRGDEFSLPDTGANNQQPPPKAVV